MNATPNTLVTFEDADPADPNDRFPAVLDDPTTWPLRPRFNRDTIDQFTAWAVNNWPGLTLLWVDNDDIPTADAILIVHEPDTAFPYRVYADEDGLYPLTFSTRGQHWIVHAPPATWEA